MESTDDPQQHAPATPRYRPNVAAILRDPGGKILVCERVDFPGTWQFPQGGIKSGERRREALKREMHEELNLRPKDYRIRKSRGPFRYLFVPGRKKENFDGQEQFYFLLDLVSPRSTINVRTEHQEFRDARWIEPRDFSLAWLPPMKRPVYQSVFREFFGIDLPATEVM